MNLIFLQARRTTNSYEVRVGNATCATPKRIEETYKSLAAGWIQRGDTDFRPVSPRGIALKRSRLLVV